MKDQLTYSEMKENIREKGYHVLNCMNGEILVVRNFEAKYGYRFENMQDAYEHFNNI